MSSFRNIIIMTGFWKNMKEVQDAASIGNELFEQQLYAEASFHFRLAYKKIQEMENMKSNRNGGITNENIDTTKESGTAFYHWLRGQSLDDPQEKTEPRNLGKIVKLQNISALTRMLIDGSNSLSSSLSSYQNHEYDRWELNEALDEWLNRSSLALLFNEGLAQHAAGCHKETKMVIYKAFLLLEAEIVTGKESAQKFYGDDANALLVLSMCSVLCQIVLQDHYNSMATASNSATTTNATSDGTRTTSLLLAIGICSEAMQLIKVYLDVDDAQNCVVLGQAISMTGYCALCDAMTSRTDDLSMTQSFYEAARSLYDGYRNEESYFTRSTTTSNRQDPFNLIEDEKTDVDYLLAPSA